MRCALVCFGNEESYGLLFVGGELLRLGQEIRFFDAEMEDAAAQVLAWSPDLVLCSPMTTFLPQALALCSRVKEGPPAAVTVLGGHHATSCPEVAELAEVDVAVVGPAKGALERVLAGARGVVRSEPTTPGELPLPAREQCYRDIPRLARRYRKVMLSRLGCPWVCTYCCSSASHQRLIFGAEAHRRYFLGRRPLEDVIVEAREIARYETAEIEWVDDDIFCGPDTEEWVPAFVSAWEREIGLPMYVSTTSLSALRVSDASLRRLRGIVNCVGMGIQAVRPDSLRLLNRSWDSEERMKAAYDRLVSFGYAVNMQCIVGLPVGDPVADALETLRAMQRIGTGSIVSCYPLQIYPGTAMERYCLDHDFPVNRDSPGDTNTGVTGILFPALVQKRIRNICKLATVFVKHGIDEHWMRVLIDADFDEATSRALSLERYRECVKDRLGRKGELIFDEIVRSMNLRY